MFSATTLLKRFLGGEYMNENLLSELNYDENDFDLDSLENELEAKLNSEYLKLEKINVNISGISNPDNLLESINNTVWEQLQNQLGVSIGEEFIKNNGDKHLDLSKDAHIQTAGNFKNGKIASHNTYTNYESRYNNWQSKFERDENDQIEMHETRTGENIQKIKKEARKIFDSDRPNGDLKKHTDMDHTISAGEIIRDPEMNAFLSESEQKSFANSEKNLNEMDLSHNRSKGDLPMTEWLENPNKKGHKPKEVFNISEEQEKQYRQKDAEARKEKDTIIKEAKQKATESGIKSRNAEALRIAKSSLKAVALTLLANFVKTVISKFILWLKESGKTINNFLNIFKNAFISFITKWKENFVNAGDVALTSVATAIFGPIVSIAKKVWLLLRVGFSSVKNAIKYLTDPNNKNKPFSLVVFEVGKLITVGLSAGGTIALAGSIEALLTPYYIFSLEIPLLGSLANILGLVISGTLCGVIGVLIIHYIDKLISRKIKSDQMSYKVEKGNEILALQHMALSVSKNNLEEKNENASTSISSRQERSVKSMKCKIEQIKNNANTKNISNEQKYDIKDDAKLVDILEQLDSL